MPTLSHMIARTFSSYSIFLTIIPCLTTLLGMALMPLLALEKNQLDGPPGAKFAFGDEFDGTLVNDEMWALGINKKNLQNEGVDCIYKKENITLEDGLLIFTQKREPVPVPGRTWSKETTFNYSSGGVHTRDGYELRNNMYLELRCKLPRNNAGYGAFWTVSRKVGDWKPEDLLEIDMFEFIAAPEKTRLWSGLWWHDFRAHEIYDGIPSDCLVQRSEDHFFINKQVYKGHWGHGGRIKGNQINFYEFFTFGLKVTKDEFFWYLTQDGPAWKTEPYFQFSGGKVKNRTYGKVKDFEWEREVPKNLHAQVNLNYAMRNAKWAGGPVRDDQLPSKMYVDYVRFYNLP